MSNSISLSEQSEQIFTRQQQEPDPRTALTEIENPSARHRPSPALTPVERKFLRHLKSTAGVGTLRRLAHRQWRRYQEERSGA